MNVRDLIALPYRVVRTPLAIVDFQLARRLPENSQARVLFERTLGTADHLAGRLLRDESLARMGADHRTDAARVAERSAAKQEARTAH